MSSNLERELTCEEEIEEVEGSDDARSWTPAPFPDTPASPDPEGTEDEEDEVAEETGREVPYELHPIDPPSPDHEERDVQPSEVAMSPESTPRRAMRFGNTPSRSPPSPVASAAKRPCAPILPSTTASAPTSSAPQYGYGAIAIQRLPRPASQLTDHAVGDAATTRLWFTSAGNTNPVTTTATRRALRGQGATISPSGGILYLDRPGHGRAPHFPGAPFAEQRRTTREMLFSSWRAYPYVRRYARRGVSQAVAQVYPWERMLQEGLYRRNLQGEIEYSLHPSVLVALDQADWRLRAVIDRESSIPVRPTVISLDEINTAVFDNVDQRFPVAPFLAPNYPRISTSSLEDWRPVQRGLLLATEEQGRMLVHLLSGLAFGLNGIRAGNPLCDEAEVSLQSAEAGLAQAISVAVELLHHVIYAQRHAHVRDERESERMRVLQQPIMNQRRLIEF